MHHSRLTCESLGALTIYLRAIACYIDFDTSTVTVSSQKQDIGSMEQEDICIYLCLGGLKLLSLLTNYWNIYESDGDHPSEGKLRKRKRKRKKRSCYARPWILRRKDYGHYHTLLQELAEEDPPSFKGYTRIHVDVFNDLLEKVGPKLQKKTTNFKEPICPGLRLSITLRYLATGESYRSLCYSFRVPHNTISGIISETCKAIYDELSDEFMPCPKTPDEWKNIAEGFSRRWQFHNCLGAIDEKHVRIEAPKKSGSIYFNYKGYYSIVLFAVVDSNYKYIYVDVGSQGAASDGGIFSDCTLRKRIDTNSLGLPNPESLPGMRN